MNRLFWSLGERPPRFDLDSALAHESLVVIALEVGVGLDLIDRRRGFVVVDQIDQAVGVEVADTDGPEQALVVQLLHGSPGAVVVAERLMDQIQVEVVQTKSGQ